MIMKTLSLLLFLLLLIQITFAQDEKFIFRETNKIWVYPDNPLYKSWYPYRTMEAAPTDEQRILNRRKSNQISRKIFTLEELKRLSKKIRTNASVVLLCDWQKRGINVSFYFPKEDASILTEEKLLALRKAWVGQVVDLDYVRDETVPEKKRTAVADISIYDFTVK